MVDISISIPYIGNIFSFNFSSASGNTRSGATTEGTKQAAKDAAEWLNAPVDRVLASQYEGLLGWNEGDIATNANLLGAAFIVTQQYKSNGGYRSGKGVPFRNPKKAAAPKLKILMRQKLRDCKEAIFKK